jgi:TRAP-type mannitol/chloroaromatic compound transport system permease small subunit
VKSLIPLGFLLLGLQGLAQTIRLLHGRRLPAHDQHGEG